MKCRSALSRRAWWSVGSAAMAVVAAFDASGKRAWHGGRGGVIDVSTTRPMPARATRGRRQDRVQAPPVLASPPPRAGGGRRPCRPRRSPTSPAARGHARSGPLARRCRMRSASARSICGARQVTIARATRACVSKCPTRSPVEDLGPDMPPGMGVDQLRGDAHTFGRGADTALHDVADAQFARDDLEVARHAPVGEGRVARHDEEVAEPGQFRS